MKNLRVAAVAAPFAIAFFCVFAYSSSSVVTDPNEAAPVDAQACKRGCNKQCDGASNKAKCVATCRRACDGN